MTSHSHESVFQKQGDLQMESLIGCFTEKKEKYGNRSDIMTYVTQSAARQLTLILTSWHSFPLFILRTERHWDPNMTEDNVENSFHQKFVSLSAQETQCYLEWHFPEEVEA